VVVDTREDRGLVGRVLDRIIAGPIGKQIVAEAEAERQAERDALVSELRAVEEERDRTMPGLAKEEAAAQAAAVEASKKAIAAQQEYGRRIGEKRSASWRFEHRAAVLKGQLATLAPSSVRALLIDLGRVDRVAMFTARAKPKKMNVRGIDGFAEEKAVITWEEHQRANAEVQTVILEAREEAEGLMHSNLPDVEIAERLAALRVKVFGADVPPSQAA